MPTFRSFREAIDRRRESKEICLKYKTPLTSELT